MENLSNKYDKPFVWKFSATSHGKGVVDGVGGKIKSSVRRKVMGKGERIIVQDCESFVETAKTLVQKLYILVKLLSKNLEKLIRLKMLFL